MSGKGNQINGRQKSGSIDWLATIQHAYDETGLVWPPKKLRRHKARTGQGVLHLILLDCSASVLGQAAFAKAKGAILDIAQQAYLKREQICVFTFGNNQIQQVQAQVRAPKDISDLLNQLKAGGGTPFREGLLEVSEWLMGFHRKNIDFVSQTYIFSDGRTRSEIADIHLEGEVCFVDIEIGPIKRGRAQALAQSIGADYLYL